MCQIYVGNVQSQWQVSSFSVVFSYFEIYSPKKISPSSFEGVLSLQKIFQLNTQYSLLLLFRELSRNFNPGRVVVIIKSNVQEHK